MPLVNHLGALAALSLGAASATSLTLGASLGIPRGGIVPATLNLSTVLAAPGDLRVWGRADVTFGLGTRLFPALGASVLLSPGDRSGPVHPFVGGGLTTLSSASATQVRPFALVGVEATRGKLGTRLDAAMVFTDLGPRTTAAVGLTYRVDLGGGR